MGRNCLMLSADIIGCHAAVTAPLRVVLSVAVGGAMYCLVSSFNKLQPTHHLRVLP